MENNKQYIIDSLSNEIKVYRQRQLTTFREALIVQAVVTWGIGHIGVDIMSSQILWIIRILAGIGCAVSGFVGVRIIHAYKERIYHLRDNRETITKDLMAPLLVNLDPNSDIMKIKNWFFSTEEKETPTSSIYIWTVITFSALTAITNFLLAINKYAIICLDIMGRCLSDIF